MFYFLLICAGVLFLLHVGLLLAAFPKSELARRRYFYSHLTLWLTGLLVFIMALLYSGSGRSGFLDYFDTPFKKGIILAFTAALSLVAHLIVRSVILPSLQKNRV